MLRRRLILAGLGGCIAAATITTAIARATPDVCGSLTVSPTVGTVEQLVVMFVTDGLTPGVAGELIAVTVMRQCPQYTPVLQRFVNAYVPSDGVQRA